MDKTLVMKILDQKKIKYIPHHYVSDKLDAVTCAKEIGKDVNQVFKTLVTKGLKNYYCFMIPSINELDLKKAAKLVNEKKIEMIPQKDLEDLTGYVHGGCSPIGMKKHFPTYINSSCLNYDTICYSAGKVGYQVETSPIDLMKLMNIKSADLIKEEGN